MSQPSQIERFVPSAPSIKKHFRDAVLPDEWSTPHLEGLIDGDAPICYGILMPGPHTLGGIPVIKVKDYVRDELKVEGLLCTSPEIDNQYKRSRVKSGDVLLSIRGGTGDVVIVPDELAGANITQDTARLRTNRRIDSNYLAICLEGEFVQTQIQLETIGQAVTGINIGSVRQLVIPVPPLSEQREIADIVYAWKNTLKLLGALIDSKERRKKALMQQLLTGKTRLKGFSKPWIRHRFLDLLEIQDRYVQFDDEHTYQLVSIRRRSGGIFHREALRGSEIMTKVMKLVHTGDFLISRMQVVHGALGMVRPECDGMYASDSYDVMVAKDPGRLYMPFLDWMSRLKSFWHLAYISSHGVHIEKMTFKLADFMLEKITIPAEIEEQRRIVSVLDACDHEITLIRNQRAALDQQKRGLMQRLLTGKLRVKTD